MNNALTYDTYFEVTCILGTYYLIQTHNYENKDCLFYMTLVRQCWKERSTGTTHFVLSSGVIMGCCYSHNNKQQRDASVTQGGQDVAQCLHPGQATLRSGERDWAKPGSKHSFTFNTLKIPKCNILIAFARSPVFTIYLKWTSKLLLGCCVSLLGHHYYVMGDCWGQTLHKTGYHGWMPGSVRSNILERLIPLVDYIEAWKLLPNVSQWVLRTVEKVYRIKFGSHAPRLNGIFKML